MTRFKKRVSHAKEAFYIICIVIFLLISLFSYMGPGGYKEMKKVQAELAARQARVETLQKSKQERLQAIDELRDDRKSNDTIERYLRKKGYGKKGELIQEVPQPEPDRTPTKGKEGRSDSRQSLGARTPPFSYHVAAHYLQPGKTLFSAGTPLRVLRV
jgi:cell division protein FtsB